MRLTLVISSLAIGGAERVTSTLANDWANHKHEVSLLTLDSGTTPPAYALDHRVQHIALDLAGNSPHALAAIWNNLGRVKKLRAAIRKSKPDCVISFVDQTNVLTLLATLGTDLPIVVSECVDPNSHRIGRPWRWLRKCLYERADGVHAPTRTILSRFSPSVQSRGFLIPYAALTCDVKAAERSEKPAGRSIVSIGRLTWQKGFDILLEAFAKIRGRHSSWDLKIFGDGPLRQDLEALRDRLGLADSVKLLGQVNDPMIHLHQADLFVMASRYEGFPIVLCQAMACGLPVIYTDCPTGPREIISNGIDGILVPNRDVDSLAQALDHLISNEEQRKFLAANAVKVTERFALPKVMEMWEALLSLVSKA